MRLYLIRHAESANNASYSRTGVETERVSDPEITETGHRQAALLASHLSDPSAEPQKHRVDNDGAGFNLTHLYCSLMTRSILTAAYIAEACGLALRAHPELFERGGLYELTAQGERVGVDGPARTELAQRFPAVELPVAVGESGWYGRDYETEPVFVERTARAMADLVERHGGEPHRVAVVVHGDFIDQAINELLGLERQPVHYRTHWEARWPTHNTAISRFDFIDGTPVLVYANRLAHLPAHLVTW